MDEELKRVHEARIAALVAGDLETLDRYVADDLTYTSPQGKVLSKQEVFDSFRNGSMTMHHMTVDDLQARQIGDAAILTYRANTGFTHNGVLIDGTVRSTAVYLRRDGTWKLAAQQQTLIE